MDPLERQFVADVSRVTPRTLPHCVALPASLLIQHGITIVEDIPEAPPLQKDMEFGRSVWGNAFQFAMRISPVNVGRYCDMVGVLLVLYMVLRTCLYVKRRRKGLVGPAMAPVFIKFWALFGLLECITHIIALYLTPFNGVWLLSIPKTAILIFLSWGRRLDNATRLYDQKLVPFYDEHASEIEKLFEQGRAVRDEIDEAFREYAKYLLKRIEVGGLSGALSDLSREVEEAAAAQNSGQTSTESRRREQELPQETDVFKSGRQFFAGVAQERADAVANSSARPFGGVIQVAAAQPPKPAYEDLRALRRKFSNRRTQTAKSKDNPG